MNTMSSGQVFIVGMNGSGTTMLLDCLAGHSQLYGFRGETKVLPYFIENQVRYGDLADDRNFARLWHDLQNSICGQGWPRGESGSVIPDWNQRSRSVAAIFDWSMSTLAAGEGKKIWCEKTPMHVHHMRELSHAFPQAKFIHLIRDGRACAASFHRRWKFNPVRSIYRWKRAVQAGRSEGARLDSRYFEIRYERLTTVPAATLEELCAFLQVPFESKILNPARSRPEMTGSSATSISPNERRADMYFSETTLKKLERVAGQQLIECGYPARYLAGDEDPPKWCMRLWEIQDDSRRLIEVLRTAAGMRGSARLSFFLRRVLGALKQKHSLK